MATYDDECDITIGKVYDTYIRNIPGFNPDKFYLLRNDGGIEDVIWKEYFITLKEYRKRKLEKLNEL